MNDSQAETSAFLEPSQSGHKIKEPFFSKSQHPQDVVFRAPCKKILSPLGVSSFQWLFPIKILICLFSIGGCLYAYLEEQNELTKLRMEIPRLGQDVKEITEENMRLRFEIESFENPKHLMELVLQNEYSHLKHPVASDIVMVPQGKTNEKKALDASMEMFFLHPSIIVGSK